MCLFCISKSIDIDTHIRTYDDHMFPVGDPATSGDLTYTDSKGVLRYAPIIPICCHNLRKLPTFTSSIPFSIEIDNCNSLIEIDEITTIAEISITDCDNLQRIGKISNLKRLTIMDCPKLISFPVLHIDNIDECSNFMDLIHPTYRIIKNSKIYNHNGHPRDSNVKTRFDYKTVKSGLDKFQDKWRLHKFINLCKSRQFNEYFWNPKNMGGRWHINKMNKMISSF